MQLLIDNVNTHNHSIIVIKDTFNDFSNKYLVASAKYEIVKDGKKQTYYWVPGVECTMVLDDTEGI